MHNFRDRFGVESILFVLNEQGVGVAPCSYSVHAARDFVPMEAELIEAHLVPESSTCGGEPARL